MSHNHLHVSRDEGGRFASYDVMRSYPVLGNPNHAHWDDKTFVVMSHIFSIATIEQWEMAAEIVIDRPIPEDRYWCAVALFEEYSGEKWELNGLQVRSFVHI